MQLQVVNGTKAYLRPLSSAVISQSQTLAAQNTTPVALLPQVRSFQTSPVTRDIDSAAKFIGAGAATVGVAGSGEWNRARLEMKNACLPFFLDVTSSPSSFHFTLISFIIIPFKNHWSLTCRLEASLYLGHTYEYLVTLSAISPGKV